MISMLNIKYYSKYKGVKKCFFLPLTHQKWAFLALFRGIQMAYLGPVRSIVKAHA